METGSARGVAGFVAGTLHIISNAIDAVSNVLRAAAIVYLAYRTFNLLRRPKAELVDLLGLTEAVRPEVVVENLGDTWISIFWSYSSAQGQRTKRSRVRRHVIRIGTQRINLDRDQRRAVITDLKPNTPYTLAVHALLAASTSSQITQVSSQTSAQSLSMSPPPYSETAEISSNPLAGSSLPADEALNAAGVSTSVKIHTLATCRSAPPPLTTLLRCETPEIVEKFDEDSSAIIDENSRSILAAQREIRDVLGQQQAAEAQLTIKQRGLQEELNEVNHLRKLDESQRTHIRAENKSLEDEKHSLEVRISKIKLQAAQIAKYRAESRDSRAKLDDIERQHAERKFENERVLDDLEVEVKQLQEREQHLTQKVREQTQNLREHQDTVYNTLQLIEKLKNAVNASLDDKLNMVHEATSECAVDLDVAHELEYEFRLDNIIEHEWARAQKALETRYVDAYFQHSVQNAQQAASQQLTGQQLPDGSGILRTPSPPTRISRSFMSQQLAQLVAQPAAHPLGQPLGLGGVSLSCTNTPFHVSSPQPLTQLYSLPSISSMHSAGSRVSSGSAHASSLPSPFDPFIDAVSSRPGSRSGSLSRPTSRSSSLVGSMTALPASNQNSPVLPDGTSPAPVPFAPTFTPPSYPSSHSILISKPPPDELTEPDLVSPISASGFLPHNLFETASSVSGASSKDAILNDVKEVESEETMATPKASKSGSGSRDSNWLPWLNTKTPGARRTQSLFFGSAESGSAADDTSESGDNSDEVIVSDSPLSRSPLRGMGSRFLAKSSGSSNTNTNHRSGSFVRRLSLFSRKEAETKTDDKSPG